MFSRAKRLPRDAFSGVLSSGKRLSSPHFSAVVSRNQKGYAVIVPKKVAKLSSTRHTIKRRVIGVLQKLPLPLSLILFPKASIQGRTATQIREELEGLLSKILG